MPSLDAFLEPPNSHEKIRQDDYIAGLAKGLALLEALEQTASGLMSLKWLSEPVLVVQRQGVI
jgi:hypothetical protein